MKDKVDEFIKNPKKALIKLSLPIIVGMLVQTLYNVVDTAYVGRLGAESLAALTFSFPIFFILISINSGIGIGMGSLISRYLGEKNKKSAENTAMHGIFLSLILAAVVFIIIMPFLKPLFVLFGATDEVTKIGMSYISIILYGIFFMFPTYLFNNIFSAEGDTKTPMIVQLTGLILNIILDPILIYGLKMGVAGAAVATVISIMVSLVMSIFFIMRKTSYLHIHMSSFKPSLHIAKNIFKVGMPATIMMLLVSVYVVFINKFMAHFGTDYVASFGASTRLENIATMPVMAVSLALITMVGMFYGAKKYHLLKETIDYAWKISMIYTCTIGLIFFIFPEFFIRIFTNDPKLIEISVQYMRINVFTFPLMTTGMMMSRVMQGMGSGFPGLLINLIRIIFVAVPLAYIFVYIFNLGFIWIAVAMVAGSISSSVIARIWVNNKIKKLLN